MANLLNAGQQDSIKTVITEPEETIATQYRLFSGFLFFGGHIVIKFTESSRPKTMETSIDKAAL